MPVAEIIAIGTELLLGEIQDTNTRYLARTLRDYGIDLYRTMIVGDNVERIARMLQESLERCDIIITTGGLGPTVDDPTRQAVAMAMGVEIEFQSDLWDEIMARYKRYGRLPTENNKRQAFIPKGSIPIHNPVGTAPGFIVEKSGKCIIALPGVPREMEFLTHETVIPYLKSHFNLVGTIKARVLHTSGIPESQVDMWVSDLELLKNPTVGLLAHPGQIDIRITAKAQSIEEADRMIDGIEDEIRKRVGDAIYGKDQETLQEAALAEVKSNQWTLFIFESGTQAELQKSLQPYGLGQEYTLYQPASLSLPELKQFIHEVRLEKGVDVALGVSLRQGVDQMELFLYLETPDNSYESSRSYGGSPALGPAWSANSGLDFLLRNTRKGRKENTQ